MTPLLHLPIFPYHFIIVFLVDFCQRDVALSLKLLYNIDRSSTFIQRFETMALSVSNFAVVGPVIRQWLKDTESMESRDGIIRKVAEYNTSLPLRTIPSSEVGFSFCFFMLLTLDRP